MEINLHRSAAPFYLKAENQEGSILEIDASPSIGGTGKGFRPMELLLASLGGCSSIDVILILQKARQDLKDIKVKVTGQREPGKEPSLFTDIHVHFTLIGPITEEKANWAIDLSLSKYCSAAKTLEPTAKITYSFEILGGDSIG